MQVTNLLRYWNRLADIPKARTVVRNWWSLTKAYAAGDHPSRTFLAEFSTGDRISLHGWHEIAALWHIYVRECYRVMPTDLYIVDAGANIGLFATWAARRAPKAKLICVEPHPKTCSRLRALVGELNLTDRVTVVESALGGDSEPRWIEDAAAGDSTESHVSTGKSAKGFSVACTTLSELLKRERWTTVDLLKIDIEGSEYETLLAETDDSLRRIKRINVEFHVPDEGAARKKA